MHTSPDTPYFDVSKQMLMEIAQALLEAKKMARSLENTGDAFVPMSDNPVTLELLARITSSALQASKSANELYHLIAREASRP